MLRVLVLAVVSGFVAAGVPAQEPKAPPPVVWDAAARRHVAAHAIVRGVLTVDREAIAAAERDGAHVLVHVAIQETIFGPVTGTVAWRHFVPPVAKPRPELQPDPEALRALDGADRVVFLTFSGGHWYLDATDGSAIALPERELLASLKQREVLHRRLLQTPLVQDPVRRDRVREILRSLTANATAQRDAFVALERMGEVALPEIVEAMNDRRRLPERALSLRNLGPAGFEGVRHYAPECVLDGVSAILEQLTGEPMGCLASGGADLQRDAVVRSWTLLAQYRQAAAEAATRAANEPR